MTRQRRAVSSFGAGFSAEAKKDKAIDDMGIMGSYLLGHSTGLKNESMVGAYRLRWSSAVVF